LSLKEYNDENVVCGAVENVKFRTKYNVDGKIHNKLVYLSTMYVISDTALFENPLRRPMT